MKKKSRFALILMLLLLMVFLPGCNKTPEQSWFRAVEKRGRRPLAANSVW